MRNIFAAAEFEAGESTPSISKVYIDTLINNSIELFLNKADAKKMKMTLVSLCGSEDNAYFNTDPEKLQLVMINLLSNAIEYSHEGGGVEINIWKHQGQLNISVKDHGVGIDESEKEVIFDRFKQLDTGASKCHLGHGLGASVTKSMVEILNGTISVSSTKGRGSTFTVSIPEADMKVGIYSGDSNEFFFELEEEKEF